MQLNVKFESSKISFQLLYWPIPWLHKFWRQRFAHRHLREIDCSLAIVGGPATAYSHGAEFGGKSIHWPHIECQSVFYASWRHNYYCQQRQAGWANEWSISLDVYGFAQCFSSLKLIYIGVFYQCFCQAFSPWISTIFEPLISYFSDCTLGRRVFKNRTFPIFQTATPQGAWICLPWLSYTSMTTNIETVAKTPTFLLR